MRRQPSPQLLAAVAFAALSALVLIYVLVAQPGVRGRGEPRQAGGPAANLAPDAGVQERNQRRLLDLAVIAEALRQHADQNGAFPSTNNSIQTLCTYEELDAGCALKQQLPQIPADPAGRNAGYFYRADGRSFTIGSQWEGDTPAPNGYSCPAGFQDVRASRLVCLTRQR